MGSDTIEWTENRYIICHAVAGCLIFKVTIKLAEFNTLPLYSSLSLWLSMCAASAAAVFFVKAVQIYYIFYFVIYLLLLFIHNDIHSIM